MFNMKYKDIKNKAFLLYSINTIIISIFLGISLGFFINNYIENTIIKTHINYYPYIIQNIVKNDEALSGFFIKNQDGINVDNAIFEPLKINSSIFRIKIWDKSGKVIWSDDKTIIGKVFPNNKNYQRSALGFPTYEIKAEKKEENKNETKFGNIFEFYIPVYFQDKIVGIVELYEQNSLLTKDLNYSSHIMWMIIVANLIIFYFLRLSIFIQSDRRNKRTLDRLNQTQEATIFALAYQAELRDSCTGLHITRTSKYTELIANKLKETKKYRGYVTKGYIHDLKNAALLHDIGKVGISDNILNKPGRLTPEEFEKVKKHCEYGYNTLFSVKKRIEFRTFLDIAIDIVLYHHEKWDGLGYPKGLKGDEIPLSARIMALADVYDALRTERPYKKEFKHDKCVEIIKNECGKHFDPLIVEIFLENHLEFKNISIEFQDIKINTINGKGNNYER